MSPNTLARATDATTNEDFFSRIVGPSSDSDCCPSLRWMILSCLLLWYTQCCQELLPRVCPGAGASGEFQLLGLGLRSAQSAVYPEVLLPPPNSQRFHRVF